MAVYVGSGSMRIAQILFARGKIVVWITLNNDRVENRKKRFSTLGFLGGWLTSITRFNSATTPHIHYRSRLESLINEWLTGKTALIRSIKVVVGGCSHHLTNLTDPKISSIENPRSRSLTKKSINSPFSVGYRLNLIQIESYLSVQLPTLHLDCLFRRRMSRLYAVSAELLVGNPDGRMPVVQIEHRCLFILYFKGQENKKQNKTKPFF